MLYSLFKNVISNHKHLKIYLIMHFTIGIFYQNVSKKIEQKYIL